MALAFDSSFVSAFRSPPDRGVGDVWGPSPIKAGRAPSGKLTISGAPSDFEARDVVAANGSVSKMHGPLSSAS
jgi:hypothetical protein